VFLAIADESKWKSVEHVKLCSTVERNAMSLTHIVEDILDVSRIISGKIRLAAGRPSGRDVGGGRNGDAQSTSMGAAFVILNSS
jgi:hypothetical protein